MKLPFALFPPTKHSRNNPKQTHLKLYKAKERDSYILSIAVVGCHLETSPAPFKNQCQVRHWQKTLT